jgi:hypothetical protein
MNINVSYLVTSGNREDSSSRLKVLLQQNVSTIGSKAISVMGHRGLWGCEMLWIPHCLDKRFTDNGEVGSPTHWPHSTLQKHFFCLWYSFLLVAE